MQFRNIFNNVGQSTINFGHLCKKSDLSKRLNARGKVHSIILDVWCQIISKNSAIINMFISFLLFLCFFIPFLLIHWYLSARKKKCMKDQHPMENRNRQADNDDIQSVQNSTLSAITTRV